MFNRERRRFIVYRDLLIIRMFILFALVMCVLAALPYVLDGGRNTDLVCHKEGDVYKCRNEGE